MANESIAWYRRIFAERPPRIPVINSTLGDQIGSEADNLDKIYKEVLQYGAPARKAMPVFESSPFELPETHGGPQGAISDEAYQDIQSDVAARLGL